VLGKARALPGRPPARLYSRSFTEAKIYRKLETRRLPLEGSALG
jgi:hypothetical protein